MLLSGIYLIKSVCRDEVFKCAILWETGDDINKLKIFYDYNGIEECDIGS